MCCPLTIDHDRNLSIVNYQLLTIGFICGLQYTLLVQTSGEVFVHTPGKSVPLHCVERDPVWVSLAEAQAYCNWAGGRVMTEEEYERAAEHTRYSERLVLMLMQLTTQ